MNERSLRGLLDAGARWLLTHRPVPLDVRSELDRFTPTVAALAPRLPELLRGADARDAHNRAAELAKTAPAPRKTKHAPKAAPEMHPDFAKALAAAPKAKAVLEGFPPSAQRDYLEWIADAKQDSTREKRIATAVEWLSEGKRRHWKYENC